MGLMEGEEGQGDGYSAGYVLLEGCMMGARPGVRQQGVWISLGQGQDAVTGVVLGKGEETDLEFLAMFLFVWSFGLVITLK